VTFEVREITDPVVGQFGDVRVAKGRAVFDVEAELGEILGGDTDDNDIANRQDLNPGLAFFVLVRSEFATHVAEDSNNCVGTLRSVLAAVPFDRGLFRFVVEMANAKCERDFPGQKPLGPDAVERSKGRCGRHRRYDECIRFR
jgi:hypothetical protein